MTTEEILCELAGYGISTMLDKQDFSGEETASQEFIYSWYPKSVPWYLAKNRWFWTRDKAIANCIEGNDVLTVCKNAIEDAGLTMDRFDEGGCSDPDCYHFWRLAGEEHDPRYRMGWLPLRMTGYRSEAEAILHCMISNNIEVPNE